MIWLRIAALGILLSLTQSAAGQAQPSAADWANAQTVQIDLDSYSFSPKTLRLKQGAAYRLHIVNKASKGHNFDAPEFFAAVTVAPDDAAKVAEGKVDLAGGESVDVKIVPTKRGTYKVTCSRFLHASFGMTGEAIIE
ncbi:MAG: cupredoxin domain-containing protein [Alphaproteobacteria bacterium]